MDGTNYTVDQIKLLDSQLAIKSVLKTYDTIHVSDDDFALVQSVLVKNDLLYTTVRDPEFEINTLIIV